MSKTIRSAQWTTRARTGLRFPLLLDQAKAVSRAYEIERLPTTVLIDRSGVVRYLHSEDRPGDASYVSQIRALLDDKIGAP